MPSGKPRYTPEEVAEALREAHGLMSAAGRRLGISRQAVWKYAKKYKIVADARDDAKESMKDFAESKLFQEIDAGNMTAIIFYLKTQAKDRGYVERVEQTGADGNSVQVTIRYADA